MIRKYHNHKPQTTLWHREEEPLNHHKTPGRQIKQSNQLSLPHQDDRNTRTDTKQRTTKHRTVTVSCSSYSLCDILLTRQGFSYLSEVQARGLLNLGKRAFGLSKLGKIDEV